LSGNDHGTNDDYQDKTGRTDSVNGVTYYYTKSLRGTGISPALSMENIGKGADSWRNTRSS
jgi:hypothetical protein